jgi:putative ABC transport system permease protein
MSARAALLRLARRDARQHLRRTLLMLALIALPIAGTTLAATLYTTLRVTGEDRATAAMGQADLALYVSSHVDQSVEWSAAAELLGPVEHVEPVAIRTHQLHGRSSTVEAAVWAADESRTIRQMLHLVDGAWPDRPGELLLTPALAADLGVRVGDQVTLAGDRFTVVGLARDRLDLDRRLGATVRGAQPPTAWFVTLPAGTTLDLATSSALEARGFIPAQRTTIVAANAGEAALGIVLLGGLGFVVVMLVAAAAFAVVAEQRRLDLAQLRAVGATPRQLRTAVTASGWVVGGLAAVVGVVVGIGTAVLARGGLERLAGRAITEVRVPWAAVAAIVVVGVLTAVVAARVPARRAAEGAAKEALAGTVAQRAWERPPTVRVVLGLVGLAGLALVVVVAPRAELVPGAVVTLALVGLAIIGAGGVGQVVIAAVARLLRTRARPTLRIALRDLRRMPSRVTPIVTALVAVLALNVLLVGFVEAATAARHTSGAAVRLGPEHFHIDGPTPAAALADIRQALPVRQAASLRIVQPVGIDLPAATVGQLPYVGLATDELLATLGLDELRADVAAGRTIVVNAAQPVPPILAPHGLRSIQVEAWPRDVPPILVPPATLDAAGLRPARDGVRVLVRLDRPVTDEDLARATVIAERYDQRIQGAVPPPAVDPVRVRAVATAAAAVVALLVVLAGLALLTAEARAADRTLIEVGAPPRLPRRLAAIRALLLGGLAGALAQVIGASALSAVTAAGATAALTERVALPSPTTVAVTLLIPLLAAGLSWAPWRRVRLGGDGPWRRH